MSAPSVFICYARADDHGWLDRLRVHLRGLGAQHELTAFCDNDVEPGDEWHARIQEQLHSAKAAVLLISPRFLASDYIRTYEMPVLLQKREEEGLTLVTVIAEPCLFDRVSFSYPHPRTGPRQLVLDALQAVNSPEKPLSKMSRAERDDTFVGLAKKLLEVLDSARDSATQLTPGRPLVQTHRLPATGSYLFGREAQLDQLDNAWNDESINVVSLVAFGGVGKSALVNHWLASMARANLGGARRVYGWSAYSQGSKERVTSADLFVEQALRFLGEAGTLNTSIEARALRLVELIREEPTLLILDGIEPLQYPPGPGEGHIKDPGVRTLVRELAAQNSGLCVITTRAAIRDLADYESCTCPRIDLERLDPADGATLLANLGVQGCEEELQTVSEEFGGHALALTLLGTFLRDARGGDIRLRHEIGPLEQELEHGGHARRVMDSYEKWLGTGAAKKVLRILGLFDRPAESGAVRALRLDPPIPGLTSNRIPLLLRMFGKRDMPLDGQTWEIAVARLRRAGLLADLDPSRPEVLDAHPLVREHFGERLRSEDEEGWRAGHSRLFEYYRGEGCLKELPDTAEEMTPLFAAIKHGCNAGRYREAFEEVYWQRIQRGDVHFSYSKLGTFGSGLVALSSFFARPWRTPVRELSESNKAAVLAEAGFALRALGHLAKAIEPMEAGLTAHLAIENWEDAAVQANNLSELRLTLGQIRKAIEFAERAVDYADRSGDAFQRLARRTTLAHAFCQAGRLEESERLFHEAELMQRDSKPKHDRLFSLRGYQYCDLLLERLDHAQVLGRAEQTLEWAKRRLGLHTIGLDHLSLARAAMLAAESDGTRTMNEARKHATEAVDTLRLAGHQEFLARGLLGRAEAYRLTGEVEAARGDLSEAMAIATRDPAGHMKLHETDCYLALARLEIDAGNRELAREHVAAAEGLIEETGYHRRDGELERLKERLQQS